MYIFLQEVEICVQTTNSLGAKRDLKVGQCSLLATSSADSFIRRSDISILLLSLMTVIFLRVAR